MERVKKVMMGLVLLTFSISCDKDSTKPSTPAGQAECVLTEEQEGEYSIAHEYDDDGYPSYIYLRHDPYESETDTVTIFANGVWRNLKEAHNRVHFKTYYWNGDIFNRKPELAHISIVRGAITTVNYQTYNFFYDARDRLVKVSMQTEHILNDYEYDLNIAYNDQDNVISLQYVTTTGEAGTVGINIAGYDDKLTPYAGIKGWPFAFITNWNPSDVDPIIVGLSRNNPLTYTKEGLVDLRYTVDMVYQYNANGFPIERKKTYSNSNGSSTTIQTYTYECE